MSAEGRLVQAAPVPPPSPTNPRAPTPNPDGGRHDDVREPTPDPSLTERSSDSPMTERLGASTVSKKSSKAPRRAAAIGRRRPTEPPSDTSPSIVTTPKSVDTSPSAEASPKSVAVPQNKTADGQPWNEPGF